MLLLAGCGLGAALLPACEQKREGKFESTAKKTATTRAELGLDVQIKPNRDLFQPWSLARVELKVKNRSRTPVILVSLSLKTSGGTTVLNDSDTQKHPATVAGSEMRVEGTYFSDDVGAQARAPKRSYWRWGGKDELTVFTLLMPLQERTWKGRFRARYSVGDQFHAVVGYVPLPKDFRYFAKTKERRSRLKKPVRKGRMVARWRHVVTFSERTDVPSLPGHALDIPDGLRKRRKRQSATPVKPKEVWAVPSSYLASLPSQKVAAARPLGLRRFAFDIGPARAKAKIPKGPFTRAVTAGVWVLFGKGKSWVVSREEVLPVDGNALPFASRLNAARRQPVYLFRSSDTPDPNGLVTYFKGLRFRVKTQKEKDGTYTAILQLESAKLVPFLKALAKRKLRVDGVDAVASIL